jgi:hypothetical protein
MASGPVFLSTGGSECGKGQSVAAEFNLPGSSFEELQKILKGYSHAPDNSNLDSLSKLTGLNRSVISRNSKFLTDINLLIGFMKII